MASGNTVQITFAGDSKSLEKTFSNVGAGAKAMASDLDQAEGKSRSFGSAMDSAGSAVGNQESKFMGTADLLDGLGGAFGLPTEGATGMFRAFGDLAGGFEIVSGIFPSLFTKLGTMIGLTGTQAAATGTATASQWSLNAALSANPIGVVVLAIAALVGAFVLAYNKVDWFRDGVDTAIRAIKGAIESMITVIGGIGGAIGAAFTTGVGIAKEMINALIGLVETGLNFVMTPYRMASGFLNKIPGVGSAVPDFLTRDISLPRLHTGGLVPGIPGTEVPIMALAGERVTTGGRASPTITINVAGSVITERDLGRIVADALRTNALIGVT